MQKGFRASEGSRLTYERPAPAIRITSTLCGLLLGGYAGAGVGIFLALLLSLPIAMTYGAAQSAWADTAQIVIILIGGGAGVAVMIGATIFARWAGDILAGKLGKNRARLVAAALLALAVIDVASRFAPRF